MGNRRPRAWIHGRRSRAGPLVCPTGRLELRHGSCKPVLRAPFAAPGRRRRSVRVSNRWPLAVQTKPRRSSRNAFVDLVPGSISRRSAHVPYFLLSRMDPEYRGREGELQLASGAPGYRVPRTGLCAARGAPAPHYSGSPCLGVALHGGALRFLLQWRSGGPLTSLSLGAISFQDGDSCSSGWFRWDSSFRTVRNT